MTAEEASQVLLGMREIDGRIYSIMQLYSKTTGAGPFYTGELDFDFDPPELRVPLYWQRYRDSYETWSFSPEDLVGSPEKVVARLVKETNERVRREETAREKEREVRDRADYERLKKKLGEQ